MSEPKKVYVVTDGEYSDATQVGVFSSREEADAYVGDRGNDFHDAWWSGMYVEEFVLDDPALLRVTHRAAHVWLIPQRLGAPYGHRQPFVLDRAALAAGRYVQASGEVLGETWAKTTAGYWTHGYSFLSPEAARQAAEEATGAGR